MLVSLVETDLERLLKVARHGQYGRIVKELVFYEHNFEDIGSDVQAEERLMATIKNYYCPPLLLWDPISERKAIWEKWLSEGDDADLVPAFSTEKERLDPLVRRLAEEYKHAAVASRHGQRAVALYEAFHLMPNLKTIISRMSADIDTDRSSAYQARTLEPINLFFPLSKVATRTTSSEPLQSHTRINFSDNTTRFGFDKSNCRYPYRQSRVKI